MTQTKFGSTIRSLRKQKKLTQAVLADMIGVTDKAVSKWERGISYPDVSLFPKLANVFGVTVDDLFSECDDEGRPSRLARIFEMSHDIRTPLHMILGCVDMAEVYCEEKDKLLRYLESIRVSGEYLLQSINHAMQVTHMNEEDVTPKKYPADLEELDERLRNSGARLRIVGEDVDFSGRRILVAEDMELNREIAGEILKQTGAFVEFAKDGIICVEKVTSAPPGYYDLILMDIQMPLMDGIEATRRIRGLSDEKKASVPIVAMTANVYEKDRREAMDAGMNAFAEKPIFIDKLFEVLKEFL